MFLRPAWGFALMLATHPNYGAPPEADPAVLQQLCRRACALRDRAQYREAETLLRREVALGRLGCPGCEVRLCAAWNELGVLYKYMGRFDEAEEAYRRALELAQPAGSHADDAVLATLYHNLGGLDHARGQYVEGEPYARRGVAIRERLLGPDDPEVASDLAALAPLLDGQGKRQEAAALLTRAIAILERAYGPNHCELAVSWNNLAALRDAEGNGPEALQLYRRALDLKRRCLGPDHPDVATTLNNLAVLLKKQGQRSEAARLYDDALGIFEKSLGPAHPKTIACRENRDRLRARP